MNDWLQKFSTAEKNRKGFKRRERSKIGKDCQHTWKDLSLTTSRERLIVPCMAAITDTNFVKQASQDADETAEDSPTTADEPITESEPPKELTETKVCR